MIDARGACADKMNGGVGDTNALLHHAFLGLCFGRFGEASMAYPGGCVIGKRPIDMHLCALERMGVTIRQEEGNFTAIAENLRGTVIALPFASVGATEKRAARRGKGAGGHGASECGKGAGNCGLVPVPQEGGSRHRGSGGDLPW